MTTGVSAKPKPSFKIRARRYAGDFWEGAGAPARGLLYLLKHPDLWSYAILPMLISLTITLLVLTGLAWAGYHILTWMHGWAHFSATTLGRVQEVFAAIFVVAALLALAAATYLLASGILTGWFNERLALKVELQLGTPAGELKAMSFKYQVVDGIVDFLVVAGTAAGCFLIGCIPVVGLLGAAANFYVDWFVMGYDYVDIPLALRGMRRADKRAFAKKFRPQVMGLGAVVFALNFVPVVGNVLLTTAAIGAVLLHQRLKSAD